MTALNTVTDRLAERTGYRGRNSCWRCPAHDDRHPSLSVSNGDGKVLLHCHAGCELADILAALDLEQRDLFDQPRQNGHRRILRTHDYVDEEGTRLYQTVRLEGTGPDRFRQRRPDGKGDWIWNLKGARRVLYNLPAVLEAIEAGKPILVAEGEHDVDALAKAGALATTNPLGAANWKPEYTAQLAGAKVALVIDRDDTGHKRAVDLVTEFKTAGIEVIAVYEPVKGKDAAEVLGMGYDLDTGFRCVELDADTDQPTDVDFWDQRTVLGRIRDFARARRCSPWAVLGVALTRVSVATPPFVVLPPLVGSHASLNLYVGLVGPSGAGKDAAAAAARDVIDVGPVTTAGVGSGEGIAHQYCRYRKPTDNDPGGLEQHTTAVLFTAHEVDTLGALKTRLGSTLLPEFRKAWTGDELGFAYVDKEKRLRLAAHSYRLGLVTGIQPERAATLLDDKDSGTPQRFLWMPATDPDAPDNPPDEPDPIHWRPFTWPPADAGKVVFDVCDTARRTIDDARVARLRGDGDALDGHALLARLKTAAILALLDQRATVTHDDWTLAGTIQQVSDATRQRVVDTLTARQREANHARGQAEAERSVIVAATLEDAAIKRVARAIQRKLTPEWTARSDLRKTLHGRDRPYFDPAIDRLSDAGQIEVEDVQYQGQQGARCRLTQEANR